MLIKPCKIFTKLIITVQKVNNECGNNYLFLSKNIYRKGGKTQRIDKINVSDIFVGNMCDTTLNPICVKFDNTTGQAPLLLIVLNPR
jgi:hypothetical protein